jgi:lysophospholipase L1-like esterase
MSLKRFAFGLVYVGFLVLCAEVALQGYYRLTAGAFLFERTAKPLWAPNPHSGFWNRPKLDVDHHTNEFSARYYTNGQGLRVPQPGQEYELGRSNDRYRILLLGPSFAFGWAVNYEDAFAARLERLLGERDFGRGRRVEVVNAGVNSLGIAQGLRWLEAEGVAYQPDLILQFVYASMAVNAKASGEAIVNEDGYLVPKDYSFSLWIREQVKKSALVFYGWAIYASRFAPSDGKVQGAGRPMEMHANFDPASDALKPSLGLYDELRRVAAKAGAELQLVYFPLSYVVHREDLPRWRHLGVTDVDAAIAFDADYCSYLAKTGLPCLDITPSLIEAAQGGERLYYWLDVHWTPKGNEAAARAVADRLAPVPAS